MTQIVHNENSSHLKRLAMDLFFPVGIALLLVLFLVTNFDLVSTVFSYLLMICLVAIVGGAIGYGIYTALGAEAAILLGLVAAGLILVTKARDALAGFNRGFAEGYRAGPTNKA